ncbi:MAG: aminoacetone oxidase family FAD-binding enzyme [Balneolales bacterium]
MYYSDIIVIGAGAAGLTAAIFAAHTGKKVTVLERTPQAGRKILMSGGTRCNVLPVQVSQDDYVTESSRNRMRNIFKSWSVERCHQWFEKEVGLVMACEEESNKWFPKSNSAKEVRDLLVKRAEFLGVEIKLQASVASITRAGQYWKVSTDAGEHYSAPSVIIASGGMSVPSTGTDGTGHSIIKKCGHSLHRPYPALTPLKGPHPGNEPLPGVSLDVDLFPDNPKDQPFKTKRGGFVFTHQGYSGPAILDVSHIVVKEIERSGTSAGLRVNWIGESEDWWKSRLEGKQDTTSLLRGHLPRRLADNLLQENGLAGKKTAQLTRQQRKRLLKDLTSYPLAATGHLGFKKAEVTGGGVPLSEINTATMESQLAPGLFLCGEILDVFGRIGGFNFYWAWLTGRLAGAAACNQQRAKC